MCFTSVDFFFAIIRVYAFITKTYNLWQEKINQNMCMYQLCKQNVKNYDVEELNCFFLCLECNIYCHCWMIKIVIQAAPVLTVKLIALQMLRLMMTNAREPKTVKMNWKLMNIKG